MTTNESSIYLVDSLSGEEKKKLYCKSSGIGKLIYTHHESCVLYSGEKSGFDLKYMCLYDNRVLRNFRYHTAAITSLSMSPIDDCFISSASDKSVCLWSLSTPQPIAKVNLPPHMECTSSSFDASGVVFGMMGYDSWKKSHAIKLFDARNYEAGPFQNIVPDVGLMEKAVMKACPILTLPQTQKSLQSNWLSFEFSSDGNHILVNTQSDLLFVLDGFHPEVEPLTIASRKNDNGAALGACFSSNSKSVLTANDDNEVLILDKTTGEPRATPHPGHVSAVGCIRSNPKYDLMASGCINTVLWIPKDQSGPSPASRAE